MTRFLIALIIPLYLALASLPASALAGEVLLCRSVEGHQVCVLSIKRSAKNFWEYRVQLRVDGQPQPQERYDCRRTLRPGPNPQQPSTQALHQLVCGLMER